MTENNNGLVSTGELGRLSDSVLRAMVRCAAMMNEEPDVPYLNDLLQEMERRGVDEPPVTQEEAYRELREKIDGYLHHRNGYRFEHHIKSLDYHKEHVLCGCGFIKRALAAALLAALIAGSAVAAQALNADSVDFTASWTDESFSLLWDRPLSPVMASLVGDIARPSIPRSTGPQ